MVARSGVVFPASMTAILTNPVEICFGSFTATSPIPVIAGQVAAVAVTTLVSDPATETPPPKPKDQGKRKERVISMMEDTLQICERAQRSTRTAPRHGTFPFGLRPSADVYARQSTKIIDMEKRCQQVVIKFKLINSVISSQ
jgi:hypothetical protein